MIFHASIPTQNPERVARTLAEVWGGFAAPFSPFEGAWMAVAGDDRGTIIETYPSNLLLTPGVSVPAFEAKAPDEWELSLPRFLGWTPFTYPFNLTQQPAAVVPCGLTQSGLPISLQIVGPMHGDALVLPRAAAQEG